MSDGCHAYLGLIFLMANSSAKLNKASRFPTLNLLWVPSKHFLINVTNFLVKPNLIRIWYRDSLFIVSWPFQNLQIADIPRYCSHFFSSICRMLNPTVDLSLINPHWYSPIISFTIEVIFDKTIIIIIIITILHYTKLSCLPIATFWQHRFFSMKPLPPFNLNHIWRNSTRNWKFASSEEKKRKI